MRSLCRIPKTCLHPLRTLTMTPGRILRRKTRSQRPGSVRRGSRPQPGTRPRRSGGGLPQRATACRSQQARAGLGRRRRVARKWTARRSRRSPTLRRTMLSSVCFVSAPRAHPVLTCFQIPYLTLRRLCNRQWRTSWSRFLILPHPRSRTSSTASFVLAAATTPSMQILSLTMTALSTPWTTSRRR
jgi:hypothetical protein